MQRVANEARLAHESGERGDLTVGRHAPAWDASDDGEDA
jgi:hypothetical protein